MTAPENPFAGTELDLRRSRRRSTSYFLMLSFVVFLAQGFYTLLERLGWGGMPAEGEGLVLLLHLGSASVGVAGSFLLLRTRAVGLATLCIALGVLGLLSSFVVLILGLQTMA